MLDRNEMDGLRRGFEAAADRSASLPARCYIDPRFADLDRKAVFHRSWQFVCHSEALARPGDYVAADVQGQGVFAVRDGDGTLRAFYNVCRHRAHELLKGSGNTRLITCPYHAWAYTLDGRLKAARHSETMEAFDAGDFCLMEVAVEEFCSLVFVNLDRNAVPLAASCGDLAAEIGAHAPDLARLTHAHRLTYDIKANWKAVVDNFLECYHCPVAHKDFCSLVDMDTYEVTTHGLWSSHMAKAGLGSNSAYDVDGATVREHAVWFLWPNVALMRYPGRGNFMVWRFIPAGPEETHEIFDFHFETAEPNAQERDAIAYIDEVLQREDIDLCESVQRGMRTPAFEQGRYMIDPAGGGMSEHAVHHFHGLVLDAYEAEARR